MTYTAIILKGKTSVFNAIPTFSFFFIYSIYLSVLKIV